MIKSLKKVLVLLYALLFVFIALFIIKLSNILYVHDVEVEGMSVEATKTNVYNVGYLSNTEDVIITDYDEFISYFNVNTNVTFDGLGNIVSKSTKDILETYDSKYFDSKNLAAIYVSVSSGGDEVIVKKTSVKNKILTVKYSINYKSMTDDMGGYYIIVEVDKNVNSIRRG